MWIGDKTALERAGGAVLQGCADPVRHFFILVGVFIIVGAGNAVNITDGLDGLAIVPVMIAAASYGLIVYLVGNAVFADYLQLHFVKGTGELAVLCGAIVGAGLGFLWFNAPPAMIFMGDTGSLSLGGALGAIAVAVKHEIVLAIIGGLFVLETASVIVQVASFKLTGKRVFAMAPLHHHFEQKGWKEPTIVIRFWIIAFVLALIGLSTLKLQVGVDVPGAHIQGQEGRASSAWRARGPPARKRCSSAAPRSSPGTIPMHRRSRRRRQRGLAGRRSARMSISRRSIASCSAPACR